MAIALHTEVDEGILYSTHSVFDVSLSSSRKF